MVDKNETLDLDKDEGSTALALSSRIPDKDPAGLSTSTLLRPVAAASSGQSLRRSG